MRLPDGLGLELLHRMLAQQRAERCIVMTAYGSAENAVEALKAGAFDYLTKPVDLKQFRSVVASAIQDSGAAARTARRRGRAEPAGGASAARRGQAALERLVGDSQPMRRSRSASPRWRAAWRRCWCAASPAPARNWWRAPSTPAAIAPTAPSSRSIAAPSPSPCWKPNSSAPRRARTPAPRQDREGYFQAARGGTLFLDEIGDLPLAMQSKLLRAIQERQVRALGSTQEDAVDVRIVSATHKDLAADVHAGRFRQDLYYRLNVIEIVVPPLRERREDLPALCEALLARIAQDSGMPLPVLSPPVLRAAVRASAGRQRARTREPAAPRRGAVATARNCRSIRADPGAPRRSAAAAIGAGRCLPRRAAAAVPPAPACRRTCRPTWTSRSAKSWCRALHETGFNRTAAAQRLGLSLRQIRYRIARLAIAAPGGDDANDDRRLS